jgi:RNA polymerase sigma factor (sigma-70 family)
MNDTLVNALKPLHADAYGWALHCCEGAPHEAADVLQNAYLKVIRGKTLWHGRSNLRTWWFGVIRLSAKEEQRRRHFRESLPGKILRFHVPTDELEPRPSFIELDETAQELRRCLARLPARQSEVLHLVFYQDLSLSEAAVIMGVSLGSARTHYERAKARLREMLPDSPFKNQ